MSKTFLYLACEKQWQFKLTCAIQLVNNHITRAINCRNFSSVSCARSKRINPGWLDKLTQSLLVCVDSRSHQSRMLTWWSRLNQYSYLTGFPYKILFTSSSSLGGRCFSKQLSKLVNSAAIMYQAHAERPWVTAFTRRSLGSKSNIQLPIRVGWSTRYLFPFLRQHIENIRKILLSNLCMWRKYYLHWTYIGQ